MSLNPHPTNTASSVQRALLRNDILHAQANTQSHRAAATFLNVAPTTYKKYASAYNLYNTDFKNQVGRGVKKTRKKGVHGLDDILNGNFPGYDRTLLKERLIAAAYIPVLCRYCGYTKIRPDGRGPFVLSYLDDNRENLHKDNLALMCYNCTYLTTGRLRMKDSIIPPEDLKSDSDMLLTAEEILALQDELMFDNTDNQD
jgi:hypothetical protein